MANITKVYLLNVPLENDYNHTLCFAGEGEQQAYFQSRLVKSFTDFSYQRKDNLIRIPEVYDKLIGCNYVMYQNGNQSNKWYYAFITQMKYINDGMTEVYIETDVIQTWLFDYDVKSSFIEREHVDSDNVGEHTIFEGLELGEYVCQNHATANYDNNLRVVVGVTEYKNGEDDWEATKGEMYDGIYSGIKYFQFPHETMGGDGRPLKNFLSKYDSGKAESIQCMFLAPATITGTHSDGGIVGSNIPDTWYINSTDATTINTNIGFTQSLDGYSNIRNKKLLCYPFRYILVDNNNGASVTYNYEDFYTKNTDNVKQVVNPKFKINGCLTPGCSIRMIPMNYKGSSENDIEGINLGKYPVLNWTSDYFTNWLTQNGVNIGISALGGIASTGLGVASILAAPVTGGASLVTGLAVSGTVAGGVAGVMGTIGEVTKAAIVPNQASGNINCGDVITATSKNDFHFYEMSVKSEMAQKIDSFFDMFGYKVNRVGLPHKWHRLNYWYTKTIDVNIDGAIPTEDIQKIKNCYNKGITFWCNPETIGDYSVSNELTG